MSTLISILIIIVCVLLVLVVLIQNSKGGGLTSSLGASNQIMGVRKTADFLEKATWTLAIALLVLSLLATPYSKKNVSADQPGKESVTKKIAVDKTTINPLETQNPNIPAPSTAPTPDPTQTQPEGSK